MSKQKIIVSGILENKENKIFLARRALDKKIAPGIYHLPGWHVEFSEEPTESLKREFKEEFNLNIKVGDIVRVFSYVINDIHYVEISYVVFSDDSLDNVQFDKKETEEIVWVEKNKINKFLPEKDHDYITLKVYLEKYGK